MNGIFWVYSIENKVNGKRYIGKTNNPRIRWKRHLTIAKNGKGNYLHNAIRKYGVDNFWFRCIEYSFSEEDALLQEKSLVSHYQSNNPDFGYNQTEGGDGSSGYRHTDQAKKIMSEIGKQKIGPLNPFYGKTHTPEVVALSMGENNKMSKLTSEKVVEMLNMYYTGNFTEQKLGNLFGINRATVHDILSGKKWKHIERDVNRINDVKSINKGRKR